MADGIKTATRAALGAGAADDIAHRFHNCRECKQGTDSEDGKRRGLLRRAAHFSTQQQAEATADSSLSDGKKAGIQSVGSLWSVHGKARNMRFRAL